MTEAELLRAIASAPKTDRGEGQTTNEIKEALGIGRDATIRLIRQALEAGRLRHSKKMYKRMNGSWIPVDSWVLVAPSKAKR